MMVTRLVFCFGAIAQLGERLLCKQDVGGSIPSGSTMNFGTNLGSSASVKERTPIRDGSGRAVISTS
jgi:hypothetical protein